MFHVRAAVQRLVVRQVDDVVVTAPSRGSRPFVAGKHDKAAKLVEFPAGFLDPVPGCTGQVKIINGPGHEVDAGKAAGIGGILVEIGRAANMLAVQIAAIRPETGIIFNGHYVGLRRQLAVLVVRKFDYVYSCFRGDDVFKSMISFIVFRKTIRLREVSESLRGNPDGPGVRLGRVAPLILGFDQQPGLTA